MAAAGPTDIPFYSCMLQYCNVVHKACMRLTQSHLQPANRMHEKKEILLVFPAGYSLYMLKTTVDPS